MSQGPARFRTDDTALKAAKFADPATPGIVVHAEAMHHNILGRKENSSLLSAIAGRVGTALAQSLVGLEVPRPRAGRAARSPPDVILLIFWAALCSADTRADVTEWGEDNEASLCRALTLAGRVARVATGERGLPQAEVEVRQPPKRRPGERVARG